jgi:HK97 family phage portal protein
MVDLIRAAKAAWDWLEFKSISSQGPVNADAPSLVPIGPLWPGLTPEANAGVALRSSAVWACCSLISKAIATLPVGVYRKTPTGTVLATDHPMFSMLTKQPNPQMTVEQWLQPTLIHLLLWGNAFTYLDRIEGEIIGLWPLLPSRMRIVFQQTNQISYTYFDLRGMAHYYEPGRDMIPFRLFTLDGFIGLSVLQFHQMQIGFNEATMEYSLNLYLNGGRPTGVLEYPNTLVKTQVDKIRASWNEIHGGPGNAGRVAILENGAKYSPISIPPETMQYIDTQKFSVEQIARIFGVAPHLIAAAQQPTYASVEQQSIEFLRYTISPYVRALESSLTTALLEDPYVFRFDLNGFERSDIRSRYLAYATGRQWGWLSSNDVRRMENLPEIGPDGDVYLTPLNMIPAADAGAALHEPTTAAPAPTPTQPKGA